MSEPLPQDRPLALAQRSGLPDEFRLILAEHPRADWQDHRDFNGLAAFWLDRHLAFRQMLELLQSDTQAMVDGQLSPESYAARLSRLGSRLLGDLMGHHQIEDDVYFPELARLEPRIAQGFTMLDADHHDLHGLIDRFAAGGNSVLSAAGDAAQKAAAGRFLDDLDAFDRLLIRHLTDEEDLVLPVVLKHRVG
jgi:hemerythrin-like domain-containing protein